VAAVDWRLYKDVYDVSLHHHWVGSLFNGIEKASIPVMVVATVALWLFARPGGDRKWKRAAAFGLGSASLALAVDTVIHAMHDRARPYEAHSISHPWAASTDASFPSDHASASLAIAFAILAVDATAGAAFLVAAVLIAVGRVFVGAHYPGDVLASLVVALVSAFVVVRLLRPLVERLVRLFERLTDPVLARVYPKRPVT
jgi:undecaprenyl-diphosphatase